MGPAPINPSSFGTIQGSLIDGTPNAATTNFRVKLASHLQSTSPQLARIHITRARLLNDFPAGPTPLSCSKCGHLTCSIRSTRARTKGVELCTQKRGEVVEDSGPSTPKANQKGQRATTASHIIRRCPTCGFKEHLPLTKSTDSQSLPRINLPSVRQRQKNVSMHKPVPPVLSQPAQVQASNVSSSTSSSIKESTPEAFINLVPNTIQDVKKQRQVTNADSLATSRTAGIGEEARTARLKTRPKAKGGLQALLVRNKEKQQRSEAGNKGNQSIGLSGFLETLV